MMNSVIHKFGPLSPYGDNYYNISMEDEVVAVGVQQKEIYIWIKRNNPPIINCFRNFSVDPTGRPFATDTFKFIGTVFIDELVWHVGELISDGH